MTNKSSNITIFRGREISNVTIDEIESSNSVKNDYYANHSEAVVVCENGHWFYALEDL